MALVSITEAAKLVRRNRSTLYRDIERGRLSKTVSPDGDTQIETSELLRTYGRLHANDEEHGGDALARERMRIAILEERNRSLERALTLEAELRKVKDQVTNELRARLADKDNVIKVLESKVLFLEYDHQVDAKSHGTQEYPQERARPEEPRAAARPPAAAEEGTRVRPPQRVRSVPVPSTRRSWWSRLFGR